MNPSSPSSIVYLESSALVKLVVDEGESPALRKALATHRGRVSSELAIVELLRVARCRSPDDVRTAVALLEKLALRQLDRRLLMRAARLDPGQVVSCVLDPCRRYWLHVATGDVTEGERMLAAGDALGFASEAGELQLRGSGQTTAEVLLFDLTA